MIVKNEEDNLLANLPQLVRLFDEVVVVDTGSSDNTRQVAMNAGARVYDRLWDHDFSVARNFAIAHATGDYILVLDADETVEENANIVLQDFIQYYPNALGIAKVISGESTPDGELHDVVSHITRFFPNHATIRYKGIIHEQVIDQTGSRPRIESGLVIHHSGYALAEEEMSKKSIRNMALIDRALTLDPSPIEKAYYLYQRGKSMDQLRQYDEARKNYEQAMLLGSPAQPFYPELIMAYLYDLKRLNDQERLWQVVGEALKTYPDYPDLYFFIGIALIHLQVPTLDTIRQSFETCLTLGEKPDKYPTVLGTGSFLAAYNLGALYESLQDIQLAKKYYELAASKGHKPALKRLEQLL